MNKNDPAKEDVIERSRPAFEAHFRLNSRQAWKDNAGDYRNSDVQKWWEGWKAAFGFDIKEITGDILGG